jgi:hypothetical protein
MVYPNIGVKNQSSIRKFYDICIIRVIGGNNSISGVVQVRCSKARCPYAWRKQNYRKCSGVLSSTVIHIATGLQLEGFECPVQYGTGKVRILNGGRCWGRVVDSMGLPSALSLKGKTERSLQHGQYELEHRGMFRLYRVEAIS